MSLTLEDVDHVAALARLALGDEERERMRDQLASILEQIAAIDELDTEAIAPTAQVNQLVNVMRDDVSRPSPAAGGRAGQRAPGSATASSRWTRRSAATRRRDEHGEPRADLARRREARDLLDRRQVSAVELPRRTSLGSRRWSRSCTATCTS
jgi:aspartyl-tRNA(Asn)/glutamyl-tRNA(Gln) amidotransferase subunit C